MYGPSGRARVHFTLVAIFVLFVGALSVPLLIEEDLVRMGGGDGDGLRVQSGTAGLRLEAGVAGLPGVSLQTPVESDTAAFFVRWDAYPDAQDEPYAFHLQVRHVASDEPDALADAPWLDWFHMRRADLPREMMFVGEPGDDHSFRARSCDTSGTCGDWSAPTMATRVHPDAYPLAPSLAVAITEPSAGSLLTGRTAVAWEATHRDTSAPLVDVFATAADGTTYGIYSGRAASVVWDTAAVPEGAYVLHVRHVDGLHEAADEVPVQVQNDAGPLGGDSHQAKESPFGILPVLVLGFVCALLLRRGPYA